MTEARGDVHYRIEKLLRSALESGRFILSVSILRENGKIEHSLEVVNFPAADVRASLGETLKLTTKTKKKIEKTGKPR